ncbi:MAG: glycosyltransferase family 39 protein [Tannerella sp.]|nr:glycosyltransferase family 39 protein [Tannerella sp.]
MSSVILICAIAVLPWIALNEFSTKGEPREAAVAVSMLKTGDWTLPRVYADEYAYKPPMAHWMMAVFSLPEGHVTEFTSRLPSALAYVVTMAIILLFFGKNVRFQEAFIATFLTLTCIEIHRAGLTARVDMLLTAFVVIGLTQLFRWENKLELKGLPILIPLMLSGAMLTKGPVGVLLPLFIFGVYLLLLRKYSLFKIIKSILYIGVASLFIPALWYIEAWLHGGAEFLNLTLFENFGRFFHLSQGAMHYDLGHENGAWYNLVTLIAGFAPWTLLLFFSLFGLRVTKPAGTFRTWLAERWKQVLAMDKIRLFSLVAAFGVVFFYSFPSSKRSVYLMPAYPFIALFIAQYILYLAEHRPAVIRLFATTLAVVTGLLILLVVMQMTGCIDMYLLAETLTHSRSTLETVRAIATACAPSWSVVPLLLVLLIAFLTTCYQMAKKIHIKILYATVFLVFATNLFIDGGLMPEIRREGSSRPFAREIQTDFPLNETNVYVMNDLRKYRNMYGMNFYMNNCFHDFETEQPQTGYLLATEKDFPAIEQTWGDRYAFRILRTSYRIISETRSRIILSRFDKK